MSDSQVVRGRLTQGVVANLVGAPVQLVLELVASVVVARYLGPELLAVLVTIRALANLASSVGDFGVTWSIPKILPDLSVSAGRREALRSVLRLTVVRLATVPLVGVACFLLVRAGVVDLGKTEISDAMLAAALVLGAITMVNNTRRYVVLSALRLRAILLVDILAALLGPAANVAVALLTRDPLLVALSSLVSEAVTFVILHFWLGYDLDQAEPAGKVKLVISDIIRRYGVFIGMMYAKFVFNRSVLRSPMLVIVLALMGASPAEVGNAAVALSLAFQAWQLANVPLARMRAPMLSRLHVRKDHAGMHKLEAVSVGLVTLSSCILAVCAVAGAEPLVALVYGPAYADAARWAGITCAMGLIANVFSLGNNTLQQMENYRPQVIGMGVAILLIVVGVSAVRFIDLDIDPVPVTLVLIVLVRAVFWFITDISADRQVFGFAHTAIKWRGIGAALLPMGVGIWLSPDTLPAGLALAVGMTVVYLVLMRMLGGVGNEARGLLERIVSPAFHRYVGLI
jgi:O-antigen/teichoic acid export membrane protein